MKVEVDKQKQS